MDSIDEEIIISIPPPSSFDDSNSSNGSNNDTVEDENSTSDREPNEGYSIALPPELNNDDYNNVNLYYFNK